MSERNDKDPRAGPGRARPASRRTRKPEGTGRAKVGEVGKALRTVYDSTLREEVPRDFLDLLGKLS